MTLRKSLLALTFCLFAFNAFSVVASTEVSATPAGINPEQVQKIEAMLQDMSTMDLSKMTISQAEELAGRKLTIKEKIGFKVAKMKMKKMQKKATASMKSGNDLNAPESGLDKGMYILVAFFIPFLAVGLASDWEGNDWLICLLLTALCWLPGFIYALMKMKKYYN